MNAKEPAVEVGDAGGLVASPASSNDTRELVPLEIRVTRAGAPAPGAWVELLHEPADGPAAAPRLARADERGRLATRLAPGSVRAAAWSDDECALPEAADLAPGTTVAVELALEPAWPVSGRVVDATTGRPVAGARVSFWTFAECDVVTTGPDGAFTHPRFPARAPAQQIVAGGDGYGREVRYLRVKEDGSWKLMARTPDEESLRGRGTPWIELALVPELRVRGAVVGPDGRPLEGARVTVEGFFHALASMASRDGAAVTCAEDGTFEVGALRSDIGHALVVEAPGHATLVRELEAGVRAVDTGTLVLAREMLLTGTVIDADGLPVVGAEVALRLREGTTGTPAARHDAGARVHGKERRATTDEHGTFLFDGLPVLACTLRVEHPTAGDAELALEPAPDGTFVAPSVVLAPPPAPPPGALVRR